MNIDGSLARMEQFHKTHSCLYLIGELHKSCTRIGLRIHSAKSTKSYSMEMHPFA